MAETFGRQVTEGFRHVCSVGPERGHGRGGRGIFASVRACDLTKLLR